MGSGPHLYLALLLISSQYANKWQPSGYHPSTHILPKHSKSSYLSTPVMSTASSSKSYYLSTPVVMKNSKFRVLDLIFTLSYYLLVFSMQISGNLEATTHQHTSCQRIVSLPTCQHPSCRQPAANRLLPISTRYDEK